MVSYFNCSLAAWLEQTRSIQGSAAVSLALWGPQQTPNKLLLNRINSAAFACAAWLLFGSMLLHRSKAQASPSASRCQKAFHQFVTTSISRTPSAPVHRRPQQQQLPDQLCLRRRQKMASSTTACAAAAKPSAEIPEVPAGCDQEEQLLQALTAIPLMTKAIARPDASSSGQRVDITVGTYLRVFSMRMA